MIKTFKNKGLEEPWSKGKTAKINVKLQKAILIRLDRLDAAATATEMNLPGFDFHPLKGFNPKRYTVRVNGPRCITFEFDADNAVKVDFERYH